MEDEKLEIMLKWQNAIHGWVEFGGADDMRCVIYEKMIAALGVALEELLDGTSSCRESYLFYEPSHGGMFFNPCSNRIMNTRDYLQDMDFLVAHSAPGSSLMYNLTRYYANSPYWEYSITPLQYASSDLQSCGQVSASELFAHVFGMDFERDVYAQMEAAGLETEIIDIEDTEYEPCECDNLVLFKSRLLKKFHVWEKGVEKEDCPEEVKKLVALINMQTDIIRKCLNSNYSALYSENYTYLFALDGMSEYADVYGYSLGCYDCDVRIILAGRIIDHAVLKLNARYHFCDNILCEKNVL